MTQHSTARFIRRASVIFGGLFLLGAACMEGAKVPSKSANGALAPGASAGLSKKELGAFRVVFAGPTGEANEVSELSLVFSRPLRKLELAGAPTPTLSVSPNIPGRWLWVGTHAVHFVPETPHLPGATRYVVTVPAEVRALDGATLGAPYRFEFATPRPKLVDSVPASGSNGLEPNTFFTLHFNQDIDPEKFRTISKLSALHDGREEQLAFTVVRPDPTQPKRLEVHPVHPLPVHAQVRLLSEALRSLEGPLPALASSEIVVETYGPLAVSKISCDRETPTGLCNSNGGLSLELSNPVQLKDLKRAFSMTPPLPLRTENWTDESAAVTYLSIAAPFQAGQKYTAHLDGELRDVHGQKLGRAFSEVLAMDDYFPRVEIGVTGGLLDPRAGSSIPIGSVNVKSYRLTSAALSPEDALRLDSEALPAQRWTLLRSLSSARSRTVSGIAPTNHVAKEALNLDSILGDAKRGVVAIGVEYARAANDYRAPESLKIVKLTDLAITAKLSGEGSLVWVTRVSSGAPIPKATVRLLSVGGAEHRYQTDAQGIALIPASDFQPNLSETNDAGHAILVASSDDDWTYENVRDYLAPWRLSVPIDLTGKLKLHGLIFTERGIYRPGDDVQVKGIVRRELASGNGTPSGENLKLSLLSPDGDEVQTQSVKLSHFGTFAAHLKVPDTGHLGGWQIRAVSSEAGSMQESFDVSEYRPSEFKVEVESERPSYVRGDIARWTARGDYLFGARMAEADVRYTLARAPSYFAVPNSDGFSTSADAFHADLDEAALNGGELLSHQGKLDRQGSVTFEHKLDLPGQRGPELVTAEADVTDVSRQSLAGSNSAVVHPAEFYVGLKELDDYFVAAPGKLSTAVLALSPRGDRLAGKSVKIELISRRWTYARQAQAGNDSRLLSKIVDRVVASCAVTSAAVPVPCSLDVPEAGYHVLHATAKDARGNTTEAAIGVYGIGPVGTGFGDSDRLSVELQTNKQTYRSGEVAHILVKSPFPEANALVTVERGGILRSERVTLRGPTPTIDVPVTDDLRPNAFVAVHLVRAREKNGKAALGAPYRVGYAELRIDPEARRLAVAVRPNKTDFLPGGEIDVDLEVKDRAGSPHATEVTLYAVDEGVLSLIGYKTPDPVPVFGAPRPLGVATLESREGLAHIGLEALDGALGDEKGRAGGGGGGLSPARRDFRQTAYFNPSVLTDAAGKAHVHFKLPESLTTYRIMAVAVSDADQYGFGAASVTTSKRLMARAELPRFLRAGDAIDASVVISSKHFEPGNVTVRAQVTGITLVGNALRTLKLGRDESVEVRFPMRAELAGKANLRFEVNAGTERDAVLVERRIDSPATLESVALYGKSESSVLESLGDLSQMRPDVGKLEISVASTALVGLGAGVEQLVTYPYGCTEQLSSRLIPLVPLRDLAKDFRIPLPLDLDTVIPRTVAAIVSRQHEDGGFGLWPESRDALPWVSAYALFVLSEASQHGTSVPKAVFEHGREYLRRYLAEPQSDDSARLPTDAFVLDVLAEMGTPDFGYMQKAYERKRELPLFGKAFLLHALALSKASKPLLEKLLPDLENAVRIENDSAFAGENTGDEYAVLMDSSVRTSALVLRALLAARPDHPLAAELARGLLAQRVNGSWRSTQETSYSLLALDAYRKAQEKVVPNFEVTALLGDKALFDAKFQGRALSSQQSEVPVSQLTALSGASLLFEKHGSGTLFYQARLRYAHSSLPTDTLDQGFFVRKTMHSVNVAGLAQALADIPDVSSQHFSGGDLVLADLVIITPSPRNFVVVDDPLPAGLEAVDSHLATTQGGLDVDRSEQEPCAGCDDDNAARDQVAAGGAFFEDYTARELRDDRVLFFTDHMTAGMYHYRYLARATSLGKFVLPSTRVEEMYTPETFGRNGSSLVEIQ